MTACTVERLPNGSFRVSRDFRNAAAAMCAMERVLAVVEEAFEPAPLPEATEAFIANQADED